jgi:transposase
MRTNIPLQADDRDALLDHYRSDPDPALRLRAHIILLLADGHTWATVAAVLFCSSRTIDRWQKRFRHGGVEAVFGLPRGRRPRLATHWATLVVGWVTALTPRAFGLWRSRWSCAAAALLLWREHRLRVSRETVRRWLHAGDLVWRRPRPVLRRRDPERDAIVAGLCALLRDLPDDETVVFQDEADINLNPDIGSMWMRRGAQATVVTPGDNAKRYLAGSLHWRTGTLLATDGPKRDGRLVAEHLETLCRRLRRYTKIHVVLDNAKIHTCKVVQQVLAAHPGRLELHFLPKYAPECNPVERVWWHLREEITRNHRCQTLEELLDLVFGWLEGRNPFPVEDSAYQEATVKANDSIAA